MSKALLQSVITAGVDGNLNDFFLSVSNFYTEKDDDLADYDDERFANFRGIGEINFEDGQKLVVVTADVMGDLTERSGKKDQYEKAKRILKFYTRYDAGIFVFSDSSDNFRLSLVYATPDATRTVWSNFRRFTYYASRTLTNKTFLDRVGTCRFASLDTIKNAFSVEKVTKDFYKQIADWYFWAVQEATFPKDVEAEVNGRNNAVIRLITRLIFIWFMKERRLVSPDLFNQEKIAAFLRSLKPNESTYYQAILQNLFFATLNTRIEERQFRFAKSYVGSSKDYMEHGIYGYEDHFKNQEDMLGIFRDIPFLNGGLFDCLDWSAKESGMQREVRYDGFSDKEVGLSVPNYLFFSDEREADLNTEYGTKNKKYRVQGLLNILQAYNFTIDENDPNDQEVALDPELLGKVFENLLASFNPETATTARKATGSYYTPREIVDYMVTESLKQYYHAHLSQVADIGSKLEELLSPITTEEPANPFEEADSITVVKLTESLRIVDPAVGSGAFPMGILNKLVSVLTRVDPNNRLWQEAQLKAVEDVPDQSLKQKLIKQINEQFTEKNSNYGRKLYLIQKCIYGVDIQQMAIEIAKLRFFIALLVDESIDKSKPNWGIEPLPNLDFKLMQGNSLISEFMGIDLDAEDAKSYGKLMKDETEELIEEFQNSKRDFQYEPDRDKKEALKSKIDELIIRIFGSRLKSQKGEYLTKLEHIRSKYAGVPNIQQRNESIRKDTETLSKNYRFDLAQAEKQLKEFTTGQKVKPFFAWKLYFAEVFREKAGFDIAIANPPYIKEYVNRKAFDGVRDSPYYQGKMDIWYLFACQGIDHLKDDGTLTFIAQNNWVTSYGASKMRNKVITDTRIIALVDFGDYKIFETSGIQTMVMVFRKDRTTDNYRFDFRRVLAGEVDFEDILDLLNCRIASNKEYLAPMINRGKSLDATLTFSSSAMNDVIRKIQGKANVSLDAGSEVAQGIVYPQDKLNAKNRSILGGGYFNVGDGIFVLSDKEKQSIPFSGNELSLLKPCYTTEELHKWYGQPKNKEWVIYTDSSFKYPSTVKPYPNIKAHLDRFRKVITSDNWPYGLHRAREERFFKGEKIIALRKCAEPTFTYTDFDCYVSATFYVIKTERINLKYLTAVLNSTMMAFWLRNRGKMQGNNYQIDKEPLLGIPIYKPSNQEQQPIVALVDRILSLAGNGDYPGNPAEPPAVKELEHKIDQIVYQLYGLTEEEIAIVEGTFVKDNEAGISSAPEISPTEDVEIDDQEENIKEVAQVEIILTKDKETPGTWRYKEEKEDHPLTIYLTKEQVKELGDPQSIRVAITAE
jgi:adenine-specific DNA-methyltransferase